MFDKLPRISEVLEMDENNFITNPPTTNINLLDTHKDYLKLHRKLNLRLVGFKMFKLVAIDNPRKVTNDYSFAGREYGTRLPESYNMVPMLVNVDYWQYNTQWAGLTASVYMSQKIWWRLLDISVRLKKAGLPQGNHILVWKRSRFLIWVAMMNDAKKDQLIQLLDVKGADTTEILRWYVYWEGYKTTHQDSLFEKFYSCTDLKEYNKFLNEYVHGKQEQRAAIEKKKEEE